MLINNDDHKYVARIIIELASPLFIGSGVEDELSGAEVIKDWNGLPYIPGTSIVGVLKSMLEEDDSLFGFSKMVEEATAKKEARYESQGARIHCSSGLVLDKEGNVHEQLISKEEVAKDFLLEALYDLPLRDRVKIGHNGVKVDGALFNHEIVPLGTRFSIIVEMDSEGKNDIQWNKILTKFHDMNFLLGGNTRNGFGQFKVVSIVERSFDFRKEDNVKAYRKVSSFHSNFEGEKGWEPGVDGVLENHYDIIKLNLATVDSFLIFTEDDQEVTNNKNFKMEQVVQWENSAPRLVNKFLMPGSSIKGVLAHRVAHHYNKAQGITIEKLMEAAFENLSEGNLDSFWDQEDQRIFNQLRTVENSSDITLIDKKELQDLQTKLKGMEMNVRKRFDLPNYFNAQLLQQKNNAVRELFGFVDEDHAVEPQAQIGKVIIDDYYLKSGNQSSEKNSQHFNHVAIDRFSGEGIDGALFSEKAKSLDNFELTIKVNKECGDFRKYLDMAIDDIKNSKVPIGGLVNKGHGIVQLQD